MTTKQEKFWVVTDETFPEQLITKFLFRDFGFDVNDHGDLLVYRKDHITDDTWNLTSYAKGNWIRVAFSGVEIQEE